MQRVAQLLGREADVDTVGRALYADAGEFRASIVGGVLVTCSDESERQGRDAFQRNIDWRTDEPTRTYHGLGDDRIGVNV